MSGQSPSKVARNPALTLACTALVASWVLMPREAMADNRLLGAVVGGMIGAAAIGGMFRPPPPPRGQRVQRARPDGQSRNATASRRGNAPDGSARSVEANPAVLASLAPPSTRQSAILKQIVPVGIVGAVGISADPTAVRRTDNKDAERDYSSRIQAFLASFREAQKRDGSGQSADVTLISLERIIDTHFQRSGLEEFSKFQGENWSSERLKVMLLNRARDELRGASVGSRDGSSLDELGLVIEKAAASVFRQMFETSEMLASNRSSTDFVEKLYQKSSAKISSAGVREDVEIDLNAAARQLAEDYERIWQRDDNVFALRYRAQRIVFDCLASDDHVALISKDVGAQDGAMPPRDVLRERIGVTVRSQCAQWLDAQFVEGRQTADGQALSGTRSALDNRSRLVPQRPVSLRAVWTASGAVEDLSS